MSEYIPFKIGVGQYTGSAYQKKDGFLIFDTVSKTIFLSGDRYSSLVKSAEYDSDTRVLSISDVSGGVISLNFIDDTTANQPSSLLGTLRDDINQNKISIATINGTGEGSIDKKISDSLSSLANSISIASNNNGVVTLKSDIVESNGVISNSESSTIELAKSATSGSANDISVTYNSNNTDVQTSITDIDSRITTLSTRQIQYIEPTSADTTPSGYTHYYSSGSYYTGSLSASADTMNKIYLCKTSSYTGDYHQIMTVQSGSSYKWIDISTTSIDLSGYVKSITINGTTYTPTASGDITIAQVVNTVNGEDDIASGNDEYVSVTATNTISDGNNVVSLSSKVKVTDIKTSSETNNGLASAYNVKDYVNSNLTTIRTWTNEDIPS